ncbi:MAG: GIY-YIG nuclease family protein [Verrucomicrobia bacterium]|nr:GIY-YIG nuclease family protein [Verrucomicrobiota bacterium]
MGMDLPDDKGTYVLILHVVELKRMEIGRLGTFDIRPGFYAYVGSAFGAGGLRARLAHHLEAVAAPHWHIDYLLAFATPIEVWHAASDRKLERDWVGLLESDPRFSCPIARFGSSDYHRSRTSHLFFSKSRPSFKWFEQRVRAVFEPNVRAQRAVLRGDDSTHPAMPAVRL